MALNEGKHTGEFLLSEANGTRSREQVTIAAAAPAMEAGSVLGQITASGKYTVYDSGATDGTETAAGVLLYNVENSAADQRAVIIARDAEVQGSVLSASTAAVKADLATVGIIVR